MHRSDAAESYQQHNHQCQAQHRPAQVVEYLPPSDGVHLVLHLLAALVVNLVAQPADNLPVATRPAVMAFGVVDIVGGVVVEQLEVVDQSAADVASLDQVVAQNQVLGECAFQHLLEYLQVVDTLSAERTLVENVLIQLERCRRVDIQTAESGEQLCVAALVRHLNVHIHSRLHDAVSGVHAAAVVAQAGAVQRVGH